MEGFALTDPRWPAAAVKYMERRQRVAEELHTKDPKLSYISAYVIAGDVMSREDADAALAEGRSFWEAVACVGSYARFEYIVQGYESGKVPPDEFFKRMPEEWRGSDPDDTDPRYLELWKQAAARWVAAGRTHYVRDGRGLPNRGKDLTVYRGQDAGAPFGIAWTLNDDVALAFANGRATRQANRGGVVVERKIKRSDVLGFLTRRNEYEVILDPKDLF